MTDIPAWVTNEFFQNILENYLRKKNIRILNYTFKDALAAGENYTTCISRACITYAITDESEKINRVNLILKYLPRNEMMYHVVQQLEMFENEADAYSNILPMINNISIQGNRKLGISANCFYARVTKDPVIVLEDLSEHNFKMYPREQGLDLQHCLIAVEKLAQLHAASLEIQKHNSTFRFGKYNQGLLSNTDYFTTWVNVGLNALIQSCTIFPDLEKYTVKLERIKGLAVARTLEAKVPGDFDVLNHGDTWTNNFMFSYHPDGKLKDFRFVDFQFVFNGSPTLDLHYLWATSPNMEVRTTHFNTIFDHYYTNLLLVLKELQYDLSTVPSKEKLLADFNSRSFYGFSAALTVLAVVVAGRDYDDATIENLIIKESRFHQHAYHNDRYISHMKYLLSFYDKIGMLD